MNRIALCINPEPLREWAEHLNISFVIAKDANLSEFIPIMGKIKNGGGVYIFENEDDAVLAMLKFN